jgi:hypothetical protein
MTAHSHVPKVQKWGYLALFNLSFNESVAARIQLEGGVAVLEQNPSNSNAEKAIQRIKALIHWVNFFVSVSTKIACMAIGRDEGYNNDLKHPNLITPTCS